jgi:hypothetical protein
MLNKFGFSVIVILVLFMAGFCSAQLPSGTMIINTVVPSSGETIDGGGRTFILPPNWNYPAIRIENVKDVTVKNLTIRAMHDNLSRVWGVISILYRSENIRLENVRIIGSGHLRDPPHNRSEGKLGTNLQQGIMCIGGNDEVGLKRIKITDCDVGYCPFSYGMHIDHINGLTIRDSRFHHHGTAGIKGVNRISNVVLDTVEADNNGQAGGVGDGISFNGGQACDFVNLYCHHNTKNGLGSKYTPWNESPPRVPFYGWSIRGGSFSDNGLSGVFFQGWSGNPPSGANGATAPLPIGYNATGCRAERNGNMGWHIGDGEWNLHQLVIAHNGSNGLDLLPTTTARCSVSQCLIYANGKNVPNAANITLAGPGHRFRDCKLFGVDIQSTHSEIESGSAEKYSTFGINYQYPNKFPGGTDHSRFEGVVNMYSKGENGKPGRLPQEFWNP